MMGSKYYIREYIDGEIYRKYGGANSKLMNERHCIEMMTNHFTHINILKRDYDYKDPNIYSNKVGRIFRFEFVKGKPSSIKKEVYRIIEGELLIPISDFKPLFLKYSDIEFNKTKDMSLISGEFDSKICINDPVDLLCGCKTVHYFNNKI